MDQLQIIHITGTKGKSSTSTFVDSILQQHGLKTGYIGSPHTILTRERICINGRPLTEEKFAEAAWYVYNRVLITRSSNNETMPYHFMMTVLMGMHVFLQEKVDVVILEVGIGGEYSATNVVRRPVACGITALHVEHTDLLGNTIAEIAWHKAGIAREGVPLITVEQVPAAMDVILSRAKERNAPLFVAPALDLSELEGTSLGIAGGSHQTANAALAVQLTRAFLGHMRTGDLSDEWNKSPKNVTGIDNIPRTFSTHLSEQEKTGLRKAFIVGRSQILKTKGVTYYIDGAHTYESIESCIQWFDEAARKERETLTGNVKQTLAFRMKDWRKYKDILPIFKNISWDRVAFSALAVSVSDPFQFPDWLDPREDSKKVLQLTTAMLTAWQNLTSQGHELQGQDHELQGQGHHLTNGHDPQLGHKAQGQGHLTNGQGEGRESESHCFSSIAQALWWAGFFKDERLQSVAQADIEFEKERARTANYYSSSSSSGASSGFDLDFLCPLLEGQGQGHGSDEEGADHVQMLVTGSFTLVGGALNLLTPDFWDSYE